MNKIDEARQYLSNEFGTEYSEYINTRLAGDFAVSIYEKLTAKRRHSEHDAKIIRLLIDKLSRIENREYASLIKVLESLNSWTRLQSIRLIEDALRAFINYPSKTEQRE